jgi:hypothetical protein
VQISKLQQPEPIKFLGQILEPEIHSVQSNVDSIAHAAFVKADQAETKSEQLYESLESSPVAFLATDGRFFDLSPFHLEPGLAPYLPGRVRDECRLI